MTRQPIIQKPNLRYASEDWAFYVSLNIVHRARIAANFR